MSQLKNLFWSKTDVTTLYKTPAIKQQINEEINIIYLACTSLIVIPPKHARIPACIIMTHFQH